MTFLYPLFALAAAALIAPIALHLWKSRSSRDVVWGAWLFLSGARPDPRGRRRLTDIPLLVARCLVTLLVAAAFAGFAVTRPAPGIGMASGAVVIAIDSSGSMSLKAGDETLFSQAKQRALEILDELPHDALVSVKSFPSSMLDRDPGWATDKGRLRRAIQELEIRQEGVHLASFLSQFGDALAVHSGAGKLLIVVTDRAGARAIGEWRRLLSTDSIDLRIEVIQPGSFDNLAVTDLSRPMEPAFPGKKVRYRTVIRNFGEGDAAARPVTVLVNGKHYQSIEAGAIPASGSIELEFDVQLTEAGWNYVTVRLSGDDLEGDNERSSPIYAHPEISIVLLYGEDPGNVVHLREAFLSGVEDEESRMNLTVAPARAFEWSAGVRPHIVMVNGVAERSEELLRQLMKCAAEGGTVILFNGHAGDLLKTPVNEIRLPARFGGGWSAEAGGTGVRQFQEAPYHHPVTEVWNRPGAGSLEARLESGVDILLTPFDANEPAHGGARTILRYRDGSPAMVSCPVKGGRVILAGFDAAGRGNDFAFRANFAPFLSRLVAHCIDGHEDRTVTAGEWWRIDSPSTGSGHVQLWPIDGVRSSAGPMEIRDREGAVMIRSGTAGVFGAAKGEVDLGWLVARWPEAESVEASAQLDDAGNDHAGIGRKGDSARFISELSSLLLLIAMALLISERWISRIRAAGRGHAVASGGASFLAADSAAPFHHSQK